MKNKSPISLLLLTGICLLSAVIHGQAQPETRLPVHPARHFPRAAAELFLAELIPICFDRYIADKDYARISFQTVGNNLSPASWTWDDDGFQTNQIGHPYHGSLFFNAFRSNGYSFWQSTLAAFAGSYLWETAAENQAPAPNDFINTGFGGMVLGEMTHRIAHRLTHNSGQGAKRQTAEVLALFVNPMNGLTRILDGQWGKPVYDPAQRDTSPVTLEFDLGLRKYNVNEQNPLKDGHFGLYGRLRVEYGSPAVDMKTPFSHLSILIEGGQDDSSKVNIVSVYGSLTGWKFRIGSVPQVLSLSANYEYINNAAFFYSGQSVRLNLYTDLPLTRRLGLSTTIAVGPILLAAVPDSYMYEDRDYDYGPGVAFNAGARLSLDNRLSYRFNFRGGWMKTVSGNPSDYYLHAFTNELSLRILPNCSLSAEEGYFSLHGNYSGKFRDIDKTYPYLRLSVKYNLNL